ncbi:MAG: ATP-binding protein, partial [Tumebacillaceae bacterium]
NVTEQLHGVTELMNAFAVMRKVELRTAFDDDLHIYVDRLKFKQVMMNLIKNGIEAIPDGGTIQVLTAREGEHALLRVIDSGVGMSREEVERLGQPFYTTKDKGTGLGLMVTFRLVEAMGGRLQFLSEKGVGTEAVIRIPLVSEQPDEVRE